MNFAQQAASNHFSRGRPLDETWGWIRPILEYAIYIFRESGEERPYHSRALWVLAVVFIKRGRLKSVSSQVYIDIGPCVTQAKTDCF